MSTTPTPYKPSPLSFNNPRQSPFRRPGSIREGSPSALRPSTPGSSPLKPKASPTTPSQAILRQSTTGNAPSNPPSWLNTRGTATAPEPPGSPTRHVPTPTQHTVRPSNTAAIAAKFNGGNDDAPPPLSFHKSASVEKLASVEKVAPVEKLAPIERAIARPAVSRPAPLTRGVSSDALSRLPPPLLHSMRESFSVMDRDNDGHVKSADVADMLSQLGLSATPSQLATYFNGAQSINLATYLSTLSDLLAGLSRVNELSAAFEAFDDADDGQIDVTELKDALLHIPPEAGEQKLTEREINMIMEEYSGRRAFGKGGKGLGRGEVFRYHEFLSSLTGGGNGGENGGSATTPA